MDTLLPGVRRTVLFYGSWHDCHDFVEGRQPRKGELLTVTENDTRHDGSDVPPQDGSHMVQVLEAPSSLRDATDIIRRIAEWDVKSWEISEEAEWLIEDIEDIQARAKEFMEKDR